MGIFRKKLKVGQIWAIKDDDPFNKCLLHAEILDIKDGYVLYKSHWTDENTGFPNPIDDSNKISTFRIIYDRLIKDVMDNK